MNYHTRVSLIALLSVGVFCAALSYGFRSKPRYWVVGIDHVGPKTLETLKHDPMVQWWIEAGDQLLIYGVPAEALRLGRPTRALDIIPRTERLFVVKRAHESDLSSLESDVLIDAGRSAIIQTKTSGVPAFKAHKHSDDADRADWSHALVRIFEPNLILSRQAANDLADANKSIPWDSSVAPLVEEVDGDRWFSDVEHLATLNRFTRGSGVLEARDWFKEQFSSLANTDVSLLEFNVGPTKAFNVVAKITGTERPDDWYVVGGHYDSISESPDTAAPGAEDNATGSAGVLELARLFAVHPPKATVFFMVYAGEEQGLDGSEAHVRELIAAANLQKVKAVITMDMIGYSRTPDQLSVILETEPVATSLMETLKSAAARFTTMNVHTSFDAWGSDHMPYLQKQVPAVLTIDKDWSRYPDYHRTTDVLNRVVKGMGINILKMNAATLAQIAGVD